MSAIAPGAKPIAFGDFSYYWLFERGSAMVKPLHEKYTVTR
jgi:HK97 family phage major capsid protein